MSSTSNDTFTPCGIQHILSRSHRVSFYFYSFFGKWDSSHRGEIRFGDSQRHLCKLNVTLAPGINCVEVTAEITHNQLRGSCNQMAPPTLTIVAANSLPATNRQLDPSDIEATDRDLIQETHFSVRKFVPSALASLTKQRAKTSTLDRRTRRVVGTSNLRHNAITNTSNLQFLLTLAHPPWKLCPKSSCVTLRITIMKESRGT